METGLVQHNLVRPKRGEEGESWNLRGDVGSTAKIQASILENIRAGNSPLDKPIEVTRPDEDGIHYIIDGERRWTAIDILLSKARREQQLLKKKGRDKNGDRIDELGRTIAALDEIPVLIRDVTVHDDDAILRGMVASFNRSNLDPVAIGFAIRRLRDQHRWSVGLAAAHLGIDPDKAEAYLAATAASKNTQGLLRSGQLAMTTFEKRLAKMTPEQQDSVLGEVSESGKAPTRANVRKAQKKIAAEATGAAPEDSMLLMFRDLDVIPALNTALERLRFAIGKQASWTPSTEVVAFQVLDQIIEIAQIAKGNLQATHFITQGFDHGHVPGFPDEETEHEAAVGDLTLEDE